jgi:hypothetical protein
MFKLKTAFKEKFLSFSRTGCIKEFRPPVKNNTNNKTDGGKDKENSKENKQYYMKMKNRLGGKSLVFLYMMYVRQASLERDAYRHLYLIVCKSETYCNI